jgi:hypothetical protein
VNAVRLPALAAVDVAPILGMDLGCCCCCVVEVSFLVKLNPCMADRFLVLLGDSLVCPRRDGLRFFLFPLAASRLDRRCGSRRRGSGSGCICGSGWWGAAGGCGVRGYALEEDAVLFVCGGLLYILWELFDLVSCFLPGGGGQTRRAWGQHCWYCCCYFYTRL